MTANDLISGFVHVMNELFEVPVENFNLRFVKYFMSIIIKICSMRNIMSHVGYEQVFALAE
jgi:hypothetical protein